MSFLKRHWLLLVGMALWWPMFRSPYTGPLFVGEGYDSATVRTIFDAAVMLVGVAGICYASYGKSKEDLAKTPQFLCFGAAAALVGAVLMGTDVYPAAVLLGSVVLAVGAACLSLSWFVELRGIPAAEACRVALLSLLLSMLAFILELPQVNALLLEYVLYPVGTALALFIHRSRTANTTPQSHGATSEEAAFAESPHPSLQLLAIALMVVELVGCCVLRGLWAHGGVGYVYTPRSLISYFATALICAITILLVHAIRRPRWAIVLLGELGLFSIAAVSLLYAADVVSFAPALVTSCYTVLVSLLFAQMALTSVRNKSVARSAFAFVGINGALSLLAYNIVPNVVMLGQWDAPFAHTVMVVTNIVLLGLGGVFALVTLTAQQLKGPDDVPQTAHSQPVLDEVEVQSRALMHIAQEYSLSEREAEVVDGLSKGYTAKRVAEEMFLSLSTVQGYSKSAYRKLGVHKKQEVIDLVDAVKLQLKHVS